MKKISAIILSAIIMFSVCGCRKANPNISDAVSAPTVADASSSEDVCPVFGGEHNYTFEYGYACSKCGKVDRSHAGERLLRIVRANGERVEYDYGYKVDLRVRIRKDLNDTSYYQLITSQEESDFIVLKFVDLGDKSTTDDDNILFLQFTVGAKSDPYVDYACYIGGSKDVEDYAFTETDLIEPVVFKAKGMFEKKTYKSDTEIDCESYEGDIAKSKQYNEYTKDMINKLLGLLDGFIKEEMPSITIKDVGFTKFDA